ncbi:peptidylprolyl isomerase [Sporosarcina sp. CAU 1771]
MKKLILALTMTSAFLVLSACSNDKADEEIIVSSKAGNITKDELYQELKDAAGEQMILQLTIEKILADKYEVSDSDVEEALEETKAQLGESFESALAQQGLTEESYKKQLRLDLYNQKVLTEDVEVTDEEISERIKEKNAELHVRHILVADEETALEVIEKINGGTDFAEAAKEYSTDPGSKDNGGEYEGVLFGVMVPEFWEAAYNAELNTLSAPVQSSHGFHVIETLAKGEVEEGKVTDADKDKISNEIALEKADSDALFNKVSELVKAADVKIKDEDLKSALDLFLKEDEEEVKE